MARPVIFHQGIQYFYRRIDSWFNKPEDFVVSCVEGHGRGPLVERPLEVGDPLGVQLPDGLLKLDGVRVF